MSSAAKSIAEEVENLQAFGSKARVSHHTFERGIFRYGLAVLSVALAFGIKVSSPAIAFWISTQHFFPSRHRGHILVRGNGAGYSRSCALVRSVWLFRPTLSG